MLLSVVVVVVVAVVVAVVVVVVAVVVAVVVVVVVKKLQDDFKSLPRSLITLERAKITWNSSRCCSLLPL